MVFVGCTDRFRSVEIVHDDIHRIDFSYLAEFFRLMGVFVCENILVEPQDKTEIEKNTKHSAHIYVGKRNLGAKEKGIFANAIGWKDVEAEYKRRIESLPAETVFLYEVMENPDLDSRENWDDDLESMLFQLNNAEQISVLKKMMECVLGKIYDSADVNRITSSQLEKLIQVFVERRLWFHSLNLQYYPKKINNYIKDANDLLLVVHEDIEEADFRRDAKEAFLAAHADIEDTLKERQEDSAQFVYDYARLWCEVKTNQVCSDNDEILYFLIERLSKRCEELCRKYPDFSNAKVLLGLCYEHSGSKVNEALIAYNSALRDIGKECFASSVCYWVGKRYECYENRKAETKHFYELANKCKCKFRSCFKIAMIAKGEKDYLKSIKWFELLLQKLKIKDNMGIVDPLEIEYLFKVYTQISHNHYMRKEYDTAAAKAKVVLEIWDKYIVKKDCTGQEDYFAMFYGEKEGAEYRSILQKRLDSGAAEKIINNCNILMEN